MNRHQSVWFDGTVQEPALTAVSASYGHDPPPASGFCGSDEL